MFAPITLHQWLPDETLFSLCSRHHRLAGNRLASLTCKTLFNHATQGSAHDLPSRVDEFVVRFNRSLGTAEQVIIDHTILPYFLPFRSAAFAGEAIDAMRGPGIGDLKFKMGLLTSRFRANHPLKACVQCMDSDAAKFFTPYWHRVHQLPGVWICPSHAAPLYQSTLKATGVGRFHWHLPSWANLEPTHPGLEAIESLKALGKCAEHLVSFGNKAYFDTALTARTYRQALREIGLIKGQGAGRLLRKDIGHQYAEFVQPLRDIPELAALPANAEEAILEVARLVYKPRSGTHPIRHLAMIAWLFEDFLKFNVRYGEIQHIPELNDQLDSISAVESLNHSDARRSEVVSLISQSGFTPSAAAREVGIDTTTAMVWAASAGIATKKRPSKINPVCKAKMISALRRGADKDAVAEIGDLAIVSVTRLLGTEIGLREAWSRARFKKTQREARKLWLHAIRLNPLSGVKAVRLLEPASFSWLYRNDREWLNSQTATLQPQVRGNNSKVTWDKRDSDLSQLVRETCLQIARSEPGSRIKLWKIYQRLPELKAKLAKLDRLPLTRAAIERALSTPILTPHQSTI